MRRAGGTDPRDAKHEAKIRNEQIKMRASALNTLGIALVGSAFVLPVIRDDNLGALLELKTWVWIVTGFGLHWLGTLVLGAMRRED